jgi:hypothetical protein
VSGLGDVYEAREDAAQRRDRYEPTEADCSACGEEFSASELEEVAGKMLCPECARTCWVCGGDEPVVARAWVTTEGAPETAHCRDMCAACLTEARTEGRVVKVESYLDAAIKESQAALDDDERAKIAAFDEDHARGLREIALDYLAAQTAALLSLQVTS